MNARHLLVLGVCLFATLETREVLGTDGKKNNLDGTWMPVTIEEGGEVRQEEDFQKVRLTITGNQFVLRDGDHTSVGTIHVDASKMPNTVDIVIADKSFGDLRAHGICKLEGDAWTICVACETETRPAQFKATADSQVLIVLKRVK